MSTREKRKTAGIATPARLVQSVDRAVRLLTILAREPAGLSLTDLAGRLGLAVQTAQGLVRTLQSHELVSQRARREPYTVGPGLGRMWRNWQAVQDRGGLARSAVISLARRTGEYVLLVELRGESLFALVEARSDQELAVTYENCIVERLHLMATGKVLLAELSEDLFLRLAGRLDFTRHGPKAIGNRKALRRHLAAVRRAGWARCLDEARVGIAALAVPVRGIEGRPRAALGCALPSSRFSPKRERQLIASLKGAAEEIEASW